MTYGDRTLDDFLSSVASERVAPAGGTAAAIAGAVGAALCEMVCIHTLEKDEDAAAATGLADVRDDLRRQREHLLRLAWTDASTVDDLFPAPDGLDGTETKRSVGVPLTVADACLTVLDLATGVTANGTRTALTDAGTGVFLAHAALRAAAFTARRNLGEVSDPSFAADVERRVTDIETSGHEACEAAMANVEARA